MKPIYEENEETLEIGIGTELHHMEKGDFALVFPELIHHYQVFSSESCKAIYALASPLLAPGYTKELQQFCPVFSPAHFIRILTAI